MGVSSINWDSLYTAGIRLFRDPPEPEPGDAVKIRFRTKRRDVDSVEIFFPDLDVSMEMGLESSDTLFDYYSVTVELEDSIVPYVFLVKKGEEQILYNRLGVSDNRDASFAFQLIPGFHIPDWIKGTIMYQILIDRFCDGDPGNNVESREYIYLGRPSVGVKEWGAPVEPFDVHRFYGGDLQGVMDKLDYIRSLGVRVIYFNPLFVSPSNHKYDIQDYEHIDPHIGRIVKDGGECLADWDEDNLHASKYRIRSTDPENLEASDALFARFVSACHERGMRVIIDGVFNHCGSFNKWMNKSGFYASPQESAAEGAGDAAGSSGQDGAALDAASGNGNGSYAAGAFESIDSPYHSYFRFSDNRPASWPGNDSYEKWWGNDTLPKLNYEGSQALEEEILRIARKWVSAPYSCDGWRLDVAADLGHSAEYNHLFWKKFRKAVKEANPEAVILAEHYGDPYPWLRGDEWDTVMNYDAFMEPVTWFLTGMEKHSDSAFPALRGDGNAFFASVIHNMARMPENAILASMNQLSNHDHSRFMTRTNMRAGRLGQLGAQAASENINPALYRLGAMMQMTWPGAPTIYYGDEVGMCGWTEPDCRRTFPWGHEDFELLEYHKYLTRARRSYVSLSGGGLMKIRGGENHVVYARILDSQVAIIVINASAYEYPLEIPVWMAGITDTVRMRRVLKTDGKGYNAGTTYRYSVSGILRSYLQPYAGKIYIADFPRN